MKQKGATNVSEKDMNTILQRMAQIDADRDAGKTQGGSIFDGGHKYLGGTNRDFMVKQGQQVQLSQEEYNKLFEGFLDDTTHVQFDKDNSFQDIPGSQYIRN